MSRNVVLQGERPRRDHRPAMRRKIFAEFRNTRPDLRHSSETELREARLDFCCQVLGLRSLKTMSSLNVTELEKVIKAMKLGLRTEDSGLSEEQRPRGLRLVGASEGAVACGVPHSSVPTPRSLECPPAESSVLSPPSSIEPAEVFHLSGPEQVWALKRVISYLNYDGEKFESFVRARPTFGHAKLEMYTPDQANKLMRVLMNIAASRDIRARGYKGKISHAMINKELPTLKQRIGLGNVGQI